MENKICAFCVNNYHLVTILMPYLYEAISNEKEVVTILETDLKDAYEKVVNTNDLFWRNKERFDKIDWNKTLLNDLKSKLLCIKDDQIVIVSGTNEFINIVNKLLINVHTNFTLINCFEINSSLLNINNKLREYDKILNTKGLEEIKKINLV